MKKFILMWGVLAFIIAFSGLSLAQEAPPPDQGSGHKRMAPPAMRLSEGSGPGMMSRHAGKWWKNSELMQKIGVKDDQVQKIEKIFQDYRMQLIDLRAALSKEEATLEPLIEADQPDESQVLAQTDKVAQARANLEKANSQMLLAIRRVLTVDQWKQLRDQQGVVRFRRGPGFELHAPPAAPPPEL